MLLLSMASECPTVPLSANSKTEHACLREPQYGLMISYTPRMSDTFAISIELEKRLERGASLYRAFAALDHLFAFPEDHIPSGTPHRIPFGVWLSCSIIEKSLGRVTDR